MLSPKPGGKRYTVTVGEGAKRLDANLPSVTLINMAGKWVKLQYSRTSVDKAGKALVENNISPLGRIEVLNTINNWRSAHSYPLHLAIKNLQKKASKISPEAITARRLKRLSSIILKLKRNRNMKLTQMQDIGGCRVILPTINEVNQLIHQYLEVPYCSFLFKHD